MIFKTSVLYSVVYKLFPVFRGRLQEFCFERFKPVVWTVVGLFPGRIFGPQYSNSMLKPYIKRNKTCTKHIKTYIKHVKTCLKHIKTYKTNKKHI